MVYFLYCDDNNKYYGVYGDTKILKANKEFLENNMGLNNFKIFNLNNNTFKMEETRSTNKYGFKSDNIYFLYCISKNKFIYYHSSKQHLTNMLSFFEEKEDFSVLNITLNSININFTSVQEKDKKEIKHEYTEEELKQKSEITRKLNLLKLQKKRLQEKKLEYETNVKLYYKFKTEKDKEKNFNIPELFIEKYNILKKLESNDELTFEKYLENDPKKFLENSHHLLFEGGNNLTD